MNVTQMIKDHCRAHGCAVATNLHDDVVVVSKSFAGGRRWGLARVDTASGRVVQSPFVYSSRGQAVAYLRRRGVSRFASVVLPPEHVPSWPYGCYSAILD